MKRSFFMACLAAGLVVSLFLNAETYPQQRYGVAKMATPVFNVPDIKGVFSDAGLKEKLADDCYHMKELEYIALPNTVFIIEDSFNKDGITVDKVTITEYPYPSESGYYVDDRSIKHVPAEPVSRKITLPSKKNIISKMSGMQGARYTWGGNYHNGTSDLFGLYGAKGNRNIADRAKLKGVIDCSGLLYEATNGYTPRNTSKLITFGNPVDIAGQNADEIANKLEPLDIIVWRGHMMAVIGKDKLIESREDYDKDLPGCQGGIRIRHLKPVLEDLLLNKIAVNNYDNPVPKDKKKFVIRRWYPE